MTTNIQLRRYDYGSTATVKRTSLDTNQNTINAIDLNITKIGVVVNRDVSVMKFAERLPELFDLGLTDSNLQLYGTFTGDPSALVDAAWQMDDLWYASVNWYSNTSGQQVSTLSWTENATYSSTAWVSGTNNDDTSIVLTGLIKTLTFTRDSGLENVIDFSFIFEMGT